MEEVWLRTLREALDHVEYGVALLDKTLTARFINQSFRTMWRFPEGVLDNPLTFRQIMEYGAARGNWDVAPELLSTYIEERIERVQLGADGPRMLRLSDKRIIKFECIPLPNGGRMLTYADQSELINALEQLEHIANIDELTQIYNRRYVYARGGKEFSRARRYSRPLSVVMFDIDYFKKINDKHGHAGGDMALRAIAEKCGATVRAHDTFGRIGGEEFVVLLPETAQSEAVRVASKLRETIKSLAIKAETGSFPISASFGVASWSQNITAFEDLMSLADGALYAAKDGGRDRVVAAK